MSEQFITLHNCYDSHTHFWATGQVAEGLQLQKLSSVQDVLDLKIQSHHQRGEWIVGFGWNENNWVKTSTQEQKPHRKILDQLSMTQPIFFSRVDGHASWLNTKALQFFKEKGFDFSRDPVGGKIERDASGEPTGVIYDQAHIQLLNQLPDFSENAHQLFFQTSQKIFNKAGFTHVRDLSMNEYFWSILRRMEDKKELTVCIESFVTAEGLSDVERVLAEIKRIKSDHSEQMRVKGIKIFIDGSLGSQTAALTENYRDSNQNGLLIWSLNEIETVLSEAWRAGEDVAIHTIGDRAVETALKAARQVSATGILGRLHLEHVQLLNPTLVQLMKPLHVTCYMQPCHWLSDKSWLAKVLSPDLLKNLFQWKLLRKNKIPFFFGSDSPIEKPSLFDNFKALKESPEMGIPELKNSFYLYHQHPDVSWCSSRTIISEQTVQQVYFKDQPLF